jgi:hypothetical protein
MFSGLLITSFLILAFCIIPSSVAAWTQYQYWKPDQERQSILASCIGISLICITTLIPAAVAGWMYAPSLGVISLAFVWIAVILIRYRDVSG